MSQDHAIALMFAIASLSALLAGGLALFGLGRFMLESRYAAGSLIIAAALAVLGVGYWAALHIGGFA